MAPQSQRPERSTFLAAVTTVAAVYGYFLIFAQFGFIQAVRAHHGESAEAIRSFLGLMGVAGVLGSLAAGARTTGPVRMRRLLGGFLACAIAAACSLTGRGLGVAAVLAGLGVGLTTVTLAESLGKVAGDGKLGLIIGLGTGLAYGFCNLPGIFGATATTKAWLGIAAALAGLAAGSQLPPRLKREPRFDGNHSGPGIAAWVSIFLALVCLDSALFHFIQHTPELKETLWTGTGQQLLNAGMHAGMAVLAGLALDRGWLGRTVLVGAAALLVAGAWIDGRHPGYVFGALVYIASVSIYSTVLVYYPASSGRQSVAAVVYAVAGWGGSALGIGLAEGRADLPAFLPAGAAALLAISLTGRYFASRRGQAMNENSA